VPDLLDILSDVTPEQIRREAARLEQRVRRLYAMADALDDLDDRPAMQDGHSSDGSNSGAAPTPKPAVTLSEIVKPANKRPAILAVMQEDAERTWSPAEVREAIQSRGLAAGSMEAQTFRITLRRMAQRGDLVRVADGRYKLADHQPEGLM
jgi:hypothetical protein